MLSVTHHLRRQYIPHIVNDVFNVVFIVLSDEQNNKHNIKNIRQHEQDAVRSESIQDVARST